jgi:putative addiction module component (TIGR02574 family)
MAEPIKKLEAEALKLTEKDRAELARVLLLSLDAAPEEGIEEAWEEEAERRYQELKSGVVEGISSQKIFAEARTRLK